MNTDLVVLREVFANVLHDHGPGRSGKPPSEDWRDCFNADAHGGTATRLVAALLEEGGQVVETRPFGGKGLIEVEERGRYLVVRIDGEARETGET